ncbi:hypothetical protein HGRIS_009893 [Hohenbuehelia grisea]|uniref:Uncharacterized protein n=1 Tax=Hohenbuehelia grisea TaxID=104357 RepID=A0ABR3J312_9AGAR
MNGKNPFGPSYAPQQPPLPANPPPPPGGQPDYSAYWAAAAQQHPPAGGAFNPQWGAPQPPRPPPEQSALYANYGYGNQQNSHWQRQQQQAPPPYQPPPPPPVHQPVLPAQPAYNPYQPTAGYHQPYVPQSAPPPAPVPPPQFQSPVAPQQQFFMQPPQHMQPQQQQHQPPRHHQSPQHPPAKRQRFDGPQHQQRPPPAQLQFQPPPPQPGGIGGYPGPGHGPTGPARGGFSPNLPMGPSRGGSQRGMGGQNRGGRGGSMNNRGSMGVRGRGGSMQFGGSGNQNRGGGNPGQLKGQHSRNNFGGGGNKDFGNRRGGGSFTGGSGAFPHQSNSFRGRQQQHANRGPRHEGSFTSRDSASSNAGKKDENKRTLTDFKITGLEIRDLGWSWGATSSDEAVLKQEEKEDPVGGASAKPDPGAEDGKTASVQQNSDKMGVPPSAGGSGLDAAGDAPTQPASQNSQTELPTAPGSTVSVFSSPPPSRMRIYFHTPVTADDSHPIPYNSASFTFGNGVSDSRKGKRKKLEDDDGDLEEGRAPPPPPQMGSGDDRSSVAGSVAPSVAETASEGDWLMAAIAEEGDGDTQPDLDAEGEDEIDEMHVGDIMEHHEGDFGHAEEHDGPSVVPDGAGAVGTEHLSAEHAPTVPVVDTAGPAASQGASASPSGAEGTGNDVVVPTLVSESSAPAAPVAEAPAEAAKVSSSETDVTVSASSAPIEKTDNQVGSHSQVPKPPSSTKSLQSVSQEPTLLDISTDMENVQDERPSHVNDLTDDSSHRHEHDHDHHEESTQAEHLPEPPASPTSNTLSASTVGDSSSQVASKPDSKDSNTPSANRLSIVYAGGNKRIVLDAEVVETFKLFRQEGRVEIVLNVAKNKDEELKGIILEGLSDKAYTPLPVFDAQTIADPVLPPFSKAQIPSQITLLVHLDTVRPLSEPKWVKSGDINDWLKSMFGRMFWVAGDAAEGWEKKITVADPDPPPTIWTVLEGWATNSQVGQANERQRFLKTHMTETDNVLEILLRLVRGERATPFSQSPQGISQSNISGPLLSALVPGSAHGQQQTHVSLAVLAVFRMAVEYAKKAVGDKGKDEVEERVGEIIRCLPQHLIYKSLEGIFKEWRVDKKGR